MKAGGEITFDPTKAPERSSDNQLDDREIKAGLQATAGEDVSKINPDDPIIFFNGRMYSWNELREYIRQAVQTRGTINPGENLSPQEVQAQIERSQPGELRGLLDQMEQQKANVRNTQMAVSDFEARVAQATGRQRIALQGQLDQARQNLLQQKQILQQQLGTVRRLGATWEQVRPFAELLGESPPTGGAAGNGTFRAETVSPGMLQQGPSGGQGPGAQPARAMLGPGAPLGYGDPLFSGSTPPTSANYGAAMYLDSEISDGLGSLGQSQREGFKLMLLFFYYARQAASGDLGAMYEFMKFINYIVAKDKARQNIQISSKLIQLQDLSRKSTEALMSTPTDDPNKINDFTKALHKAKSEETTIATSQKLLADMLQEFAHVTESLVNSTKALQEAWGRVLRTASARA